MSQIMTKRVLLAVILVVALMALYVEAQRYGGGYGGGYGRGGGRGYYGGGGRGYGGYGGGRGRGYGGGYGGGRGYGGGYGRGYRDPYESYNSVYPSYSSSGSGGGYYDELDGDDYSSYGLDVYATSSSNPSLSASGGSDAPDDSETADGSSNRATFDNGGQASRDQWRQTTRGASQQPNSVLDVLNTARSGSANQWPIVDDGSQAWQQSAANGDLFDLMTGGDQSASRRSTSLANTSDRANERHVLSPSARADRRDPLSSGSRQSSAAVAAGGLNNTPSVPTSTTTPAPEFVMINPTTST